VSPYISTDPDYTEPLPKHTVNLISGQYVTEWAVFKALDTLHATTAGLDEVPAWFLRLGAAVFVKPLAQLINLSLSASVVPSQWKRASICPVAKTASPRELSDFRPISYLSHPSYPELLSGLSSASFYIRPSFHNQLHFSSQINTRSVQRDLLLHAALISIFATITSSLACNVVVVALDSSTFQT